MFYSGGAIVVCPFELYQLPHSAYTRVSQSKRHFNVSKPYIVPKNECASPPKIIMTFPFMVTTVVYGFHDTFCQKSHSVEIFGDFL